MMNDLAQMVLKRVTARVVAAIRLAVDVAQASGIPAKIMARVFPATGYGGCCHRHQEAAEAPYVPPAPVKTTVAAGVAEGSVVPPATASRTQEKKRAAPARGKKKSPRRKIGKDGPVQLPPPLPEGVRALKRKDELAGSTYLARIVWCLGIATREGTGPLRPADIARMVMARSPVTLEPPNIARYIRRAKPKAIVVAQREGGSNFYALSPIGQQLFDDTFLR